MNSSPPLRKRKSGWRICSPITAAIRRRTCLLAHDRKRLFRLAKSSRSKRISESGLPIAASAGNLFGSQGTKAFLVEQAGKWINQSLGRLRLDGFQARPPAGGRVWISLRKLGIGF